MSYFLGIDTGTSSTKSMLMDELGNIIDIYQQGYDVISERVSWAELPVENVWEAVKKTLKALSAAHPDKVKEIEAISFSGQMHSVVMLGSDMKPLYNAITWMDTRSKKEAEYLNGICAEKGYRERLYNIVPALATISVLRWVRVHRSDLLEKTRTILLVKDYIRFLLTGEVGTDYSDASGTMGIDLEKREWLWELIDDLELPRDIFPDIHYAHEIAGAVTAEAAALTGLKEGTKVCFGGGDTLMNHIGNGLIDQDGRILSTIGSSSHVSVCLPRPMTDPNMNGAIYAHALPERWLAIVGGTNGGIVLKWLKNNILGNTLSFDEMSELAAQAPPGSNGVWCVPYINGAQYPNKPSARSIYVGLGYAHNQSELIRSTMEGMVLILKKSLLVVEEMGIKPASIIATGGGALDKVLLQIQADMFDLPVSLNSGREISCMGAAICAAVGSGYYRDYKEACSQIVRFNENVIEPDKNNTEVYNEMLGRFDDIFAANERFFDT